MTTNEKPNHKPQRGDMENPIGSDQLSPDRKLANNSVASFCLENEIHVHRGMRILLFEDVKKAIAEIKKRLQQKAIEDSDGKTSYFNQMLIIDEIIGKRLVEE